MSSARLDIDLHFNHFVKRQQQNKLDQRMMQAFIARCAVVIGANSQPGFDAVLPTIQGRAPMVSHSTQGLIIRQFKNDDEYAFTVDVSLFNSMDPVAMGFIGPDDQLETPNIRIVFALGAKTLLPVLLSVHEVNSFASCTLRSTGRESSGLMIYGLLVSPQMFLLSPARKRPRCGTRYFVRQEDGGPCISTGI
ncbi:hypothetical protein OE88DRAFT_153527 [Heliocybe sulcata]|uniref:Uncharacterized protein n=1 Tax=Heliocybe sulcata TaxID=5364 RepID=A0A5C3NJN9_9AGAM|nr:hypothetical protein OE88DRAFT_153527 [Heliocybe sulcata]